MRQSLFVVVVALVALSPALAGPINAVWAPATTGWTVGPVLTEAGDAGEIVEFGPLGLGAAPESGSECGGPCLLQEAWQPDNSYCEMCEVPESPGQWLSLAGLAALLIRRAWRRQASSSRQP